jgi:GT2 family glycosyltransferase
MLMEKLPFVSVVVATYNRKKMLGDCINSLFNQTYPKEEYEVIIINDGSTDGTEDTLIEYAKRAPCGFKWFTQDNSGQTVAFNLGIKNSTGEVVCITGDDCIMDTACIQNLIRGYDRKEVGAVGGRILGMKTDGFVENYTEKSRMFSQEDFIYHFIVGGNSSYRKSVLDEIKGFDEFFRHGQDTEICMRIRLKGYSLRYLPESIVYHKHKATVCDILGQFYRYERTYSRLHKKYPRNFNFNKRVSSLGLRLMRKGIITPYKVLKSLFTDNMVDYISEHLMDIASLTYMIWGNIDETIFGESYPGEKIDIKLEFMTDADIRDGWGL